jgi:hypothetical protein
MVLSQLILLLIIALESAESFVRVQPKLKRHPTVSLASTADRASQGFALTVDEKPKSSPLKAKKQLLDLVPHMTGRDYEFRQVEDLVNTLEASYMPAQTLSFLNLAIQGEWQLLFSTNISGTPNSAKFRLREVLQTITTNKLHGTISTMATWDLAQAADANFDCSGTFQILHTYEINQGARMILKLSDHILRPAKGSPVPDNVQGLVGLLHRSLPKELFDASEHAVDTTYCDADLRIVRHTGPRLEGVRDIFIRKGAFEIDPRNKQ